MSTSETTRSLQLQCTTALKSNISSGYCTSFQSSFLINKFFASSQAFFHLAAFRLEGNPLCNDSLLSETMPCTGQRTEPPTPPLVLDVQCANPFIETIVFRAPSFGDVMKYLDELHRNLSGTLSSCTPNRLGLVPYSNDDEYLNVDIKACPVNQKRFNYSQVLNCFNLTLQTYKPPEIFGPYYVKARPYLFHDKGNCSTCQYYF